jgi:hypothetical protein
MQLIGPHPFDLDAQQRQITRIGTLFPSQDALYTQLPGVHAWQRMGFRDQLNTRRAEAARPPLSPQEEEDLFSESVDLIFEPDCILIRPNPERMDLAFEGDELLQQLVSKRRIKFLSVGDHRVRDAIKQRGECWRLSAIPKTREAKKQWVNNSKVAIRGLPIYYYNRLTGTRWLTFQEFEGLGLLPPVGLARHLQEIADHAICRNRLGRPEVDFFAADMRQFGSRHFSGVAFEKLPLEALRREFATLRDHFSSAVHEAFRRDDCANKAWAERMLGTLFLDGSETQTEQLLGGLSPEFFMQIEWLPGGRFEEGEFLFDPIFEEAEHAPQDEELQYLCDPRAKGIIFNLIREYGDLDYINVGRVPESLSLERPQTRGRRGVFLTEFKSGSLPHPIKRFMRLQKWGVWEHLDEGKDLLQSIQQSDDYTDYWLDRRLGCRQLCMNLPDRVVMRRLSETYLGSNDRYRTESIRTTYFERDYLEGIATDKLPAEKYEKPGYALALARLLGQAAAPSMIVGRSLELGRQPVFDDGDEVVREGADGLPGEILVGDHSGAFGEYLSPLETFASHYARPINKRDKFLPNPREFARIYLEAFCAQFLHIQGDYRKRRRAFDKLFRHCRYDRGGSFAFRWECTLKRLDNTDLETVVAAIRKHIWVLNLGKPEAAVLPAEPPAAPRLPAAGLSSSSC